MVLGPFPFPNRVRHCDAMLGTVQWAYRINHHPTRLRERTMRIVIPVVIDVDPATWAEQNSVEPSEVRADIKSYVQNVLQCGAPSLEDAEAEVTVR